MCPEFQEQYGAAHGAELLGDFDGGQGFDPVAPGEIADHHATQTVNGQKRSKQPHRIDDTRLSNPVRRYEWSAKIDDERNTAACNHAV